MTREISTRSFHIKPHREVFFDAIYRDGGAENELVLNCLSGEATGLIGGWDRRFEYPLLQQRVTANRELLCSPVLGMGHPAGELSRPRRGDVRSGE